MAMKVVIHPDLETMKYLIGDNKDALLEIQNKVFAEFEREFLDRRLRDEVARKVQSELSRQVEDELYQYINNYRYNYNSSAKQKDFNKVLNEQIEKKVNEEIAKAAKAAEDRLSAQIKERVEMLERQMNQYMDAVIDTALAERVQERASRLLRAALKEVEDEF